MIFKKKFTGFNLSTLFNFNTLHYDESRDNLMEYYFLMKDELFDPIDGVTLEAIYPYDVRIMNTNCINDNTVYRAI